MIWKMSIKKLDNWDERKGLIEYCICRNYPAE